MNGGGKKQYTLYIRTNMCEIYFHWTKLWSCLASYFRDVDAVARLESFRALKSSEFESFRALKLSGLETFRGLKFSKMENFRMLGLKCISSCSDYFSKILKIFITRFEIFRALKLSNLAELFRTLKLSNLESFRVLNLSKLESFRALKLCRLESFRVLKGSARLDSFRALKLSDFESFRALKL